MYLRPPNVTDVQDVLIEGRNLSKHLHLLLKAIDSKTLAVVSLNLRHIN